MTAHIDANFGEQSQVLGIKDARRQPQEIDYDSPLHPVWPLDAGGFAGATPDLGQYTALAIAGASSQTKEMVTPGGLGGVVITSAVPGSPAAAPRQNFRATGLYGYIIFDAAGAAAFAGKRIKVFWSLFSVVKNFQVDCLGVTETVVAAQLAYRLHLDNFTGLVVPDQFRLRATAISLDSTVFPANTTWQTGVVGWLMPLHARLPF